MREGDAAIAFRRDDGFDTGCGQLGADGICVVTLVGEQRVDAFIEHSEQRTEAFHIVRLARRQDEAKRSPVPIAAGVELGGEAPARAAKPLGLLIPFMDGSPLI